MTARAVDAAQACLPECILSKGNSAVIGEKDVLGFVDARREERRTADVGVQALHQAAVRLADIRRGSPKFKTKDLVSLLLSHGARAWRNSLPAASIRLQVLTPSGKAAVKIRLK